MYNKKIAVIPGSYDPITVGHLDLIKRASEMFEKVYVLISVNSSKIGFVDVHTRKFLVEDAVKGMKNVEVCVSGGLFADFCHEHKIGTVVKGIRNHTDYAYEMELLAYNNKIFSDKYSTETETIFLPSKPELCYCSSTFVREMLKYNENVENYVPNAELLLKHINLP